MKRARLLALLGAILILTPCIVAGESAPPPAPAPKFQNDFFGDMARAFGFIVSIDTKAQTMTVRLDNEKTVTVPIKFDTELHVRDSWGELSDYYEGQRVMLFMYVDDEKKWTYPRAVQCEIHVSAGHNWYAAVTAIDKEAKTYSTHREEKDNKGVVTKKIDATFHYDPAVKVWKGETAGGIETLQIGDEVIPQQIWKDGKKVAIEILDRKGNAALKAVQDTKHKKDEETLGLPAYVTDFETLHGALSVTVAWSSAGRAKQLKPGMEIVIQPVDGSKPFAAMVCSTKGVDSRCRLELAVRSHVVARLAYGQLLRVFMPGSGPELPTGKLGIPDLTKK